MHVGADNRAPQSKFILCSELWLARNPRLILLFGFNSSASAARKVCYRESVCGVQICRDCFATHCIRPILARMECFLNVPTFRAGVGQIDADSCFSPTSCWVLITGPHPASHSC